MSSDQPSTQDPEPIEAEFEPAGGARPEGAPRPQSSDWGRKPVSRLQLATGCGLAILASVLTSVGVMQASNQAGPGTVMREIETLKTEQAGLSTRTAQFSEDIVALRSKVDSQADRLKSGQDADAMIRAELAEISQQLTAVIGADPKEADAAVSAAGNPLGVLLQRIARLESIIQEDASSPQTTRQMQRALRDLSDQVAALDEASTSLTASLNKRQAALAALENGLTALSTDVATLKQRLDQAKNLETQIGAVRESVTALKTETNADRAPILAAAAHSRSIRALSALETAAAHGKPFASQHQALMTLMPADPDVQAMKATARKGAPALVDLREEFDVAAKRAEQAAAAEVDDGWNWLRTSVSGVMTLRRTGVDTSASQLIKQAKRSMDIGDVGGALASVDQMTGPSANAFSAWRSKAAVRAELDGQIESLNTRLIAATDAKGGPRGQ